MKRNKNKMDVHEARKQFKGYGGGAGSPIPPISINPEGWRLHFACNREQRPSLPSPPSSLSKQVNNMNAIHIITILQYEILIWYNIARPN